MVLVQYWDRLYFGESSPYKGDSAQFLLSLKSWKRGLNGVVSGYPTTTNIQRVDGLSTDPREMGRHRDLEKLQIFSNGKLPFYYFP